HHDCRGHPGRDPRRHQPDRQSAARSLILPVWGFPSLQGRRSIYFLEVTSMKTFSIIALAALHGSLCIGAELPRSSPEAQGVSSAAVLAFVEAADQNIHSMNSFMLL